MVIMKKQASQLIALTITVLSLAVVAAPAEAGSPNGASLRSKYSSFQDSQRRETAREIMAWSQQRGGKAGSLEQGLREMGFSGREIVQAVVKSNRDGRRHHVTLWFDNRNDPWVLDATGAATQQMTRLSQLGQWAPVELASNTANYRIQGDRVQPSQMLSRR